MRNDRSFNARVLFGEFRVCSSNNWVYVCLINKLNGMRLAKFALSG